jgi:hypothetical protein
VVTREFIEDSSRHDKLYSLPKLPTTPYKNPNPTFHPFPSTTSSVKTGISRKAINSPQEFVDT